MFGGGIIGQTLGLVRSTTVAPSTDTVLQNGSTPMSIGIVFNPVPPQNKVLLPKAANGVPNTNIIQCCISGQGQFSNSCLYEIALTDRKLLKQAPNGQVPPPKGNLAMLMSANPNAPPQGNMFVANTNQTTAAPNVSMFGGQTAPQLAPAPTARAGGLFGQQPITAAPATGGLFGGATTTQPTNGGLFGATNPGATMGGLFGGATATPATGGGGLFGGATTTATAPLGGGLFGATTAPAGGGLFGATQPTGGGLFGAAAAPAGGLFGSAQPTATGGLFGNQLAQQQQQQQPGRVDEIAREIERLEQAKAAKESEKKRKEEEEVTERCRKFTSSRHSVHHINYLKSQQEQRDVVELYSQPATSTQINTFIEAPYSVKLNVSQGQVKKSEWQLLQKYQEMKQNQYQNNSLSSSTNPLIGNTSNNQLSNRLSQATQLHSSSLGKTSQQIYSQLREIERTSSTRSNGLGRQSVREMEESFKQDQKDSFTQTDYFKKQKAQIDSANATQLIDSTSEQRLDNTKATSITYLYEQSQKRAAKVFSTSVSIRISADRETISIPLEVKSTFTIGYLLTLVFDYIEEKLGVDPESFPIYNSHYILYQPLEIDHLLQVRKTDIISEIETSNSGRIGHFEVIQMNIEEEKDSNYQNGDQIDVEDEDLFLDDEDEEEQLNRLARLPIIPEGFTIEPSLVELGTKSVEQLRRFKNFKIRNQFAEVCFEGEIDLNGRDFSRELLIDENQVLIYPYHPQDQLRIAPGYGINVQATIKRFKALGMLKLPREQFNMQTVERRLHKIAAECKMQIVEPYNQVTDTFTVRVPHF